MSTPLENAINLFFKGRLRAINKLHHPNDERRLYNVALESVREGTGLPEEKFRSAFDKEVKDEGINAELAEEWYTDYLEVLENTYSVLKIMYAKDVIPKDFTF